MAAATRSTTRVAVLHRRGGCRRYHRLSCWTENGRTTGCLSVAAHPGAHDRGVAMISYGLNKLYRMQFAEISYARLVDTYGQTSPMGLLWHSWARTPYSVLAGLGKCWGATSSCLNLPSRIADHGRVMSNVLM